MSVAGKHSYRFGFLKSEHWEIVRVEALARDDAKCQLCGCRSLDNDEHHLMYRLNWENTESQDLVTLCRDCHDIIHLLLKPKGEVLMRDADETLERAKMEFEFAKEIILRMERLFKKCIKTTTLYTSEKRALKIGCAWCFNREVFCSVILGSFFRPKFPTNDWRVTVCQSCYSQFPNSFSGVKEMRYYFTSHYKAKSELLKNHLTRVAHGNKSQISREKSPA